METAEKNVSAQFVALIEADDALALRQYINSQNISDVVELVYEMPAYEQQIMGALSIHRAASVFKMLDLAEQKRIVKHLPSFRTAELLNELPPDDRTDFLEELSKETIRDLIKLMSPEERKVTLQLLGYAENSVGRLMTPDYVYVYPQNTVTEVFATIRQFARGSETIDVIYVINEQGELVDDLRIRDVILAPPERTVSQLIDGRVIALNANDDQEDAGQVFKMNNRVALPVTDDHNVLLGIVTIDDMLWVTSEEFSEDMQKMGGSQALEQPYLDVPLLQLFGKRVGWLIILFIGEMFTATAMGYFEDEIARAVVLALFVPLIISSGGNSGSQASTLIIQAMAVGDVGLSDWFRVLKRELISGALLGLTLGLIGYARVAVWHIILPEVYGIHWSGIGLTVGISLVGVVLWGTLSGSMLPMLLKRLGFDPAVSSAPFVATLVDVTGLLIYFSVAFMILKGSLL